MHNLSYNRKFIVLAAATGINMTMGVNYSWSIFKKALVNERLWSNLDASLPYIVYIAIFALTMPLAGRMQDRYGPRIVTCLGALMIGAGLIACSFCNTVMPLVLAYSLMGIGNSLCYSTTMPTVIKWFTPERRGAVTGIVVGGASMASFYISPAASWLLSKYGISRTFLIFGVVVSIVVIFLAQFMKNPPIEEVSKKQNTVPSEMTANISIKNYTWQEMIRTLTFYKLWIMYVFASSAGLMIIGHIATIAKTQAKWEYGYYLVMVLALFNTAGRLSAGILSDKYGRITILLCALIIQMLNMAGFIYYATPLLLIFGVSVTALCYGSFISLVPLLVADFYGIKNVGVNFGLVFTAWGVAGFLGPVLAAWSVDTTASYHSAYFASAILLVAATSLTFSLKKRST